MAVTESSDQDRPQRRRALKTTKYAMPWTLLERRDGMIAVKADGEAVGERVDGSLAAAQTLATAKRS